MVWTEEPGGPRRQSRNGLTDLLRVRTINGYSVGLITQVAVECLIYDEFVGHYQTVAAAAWHGSLPLEHRGIDGFVDARDPIIFVTM